MAELSRGEALTMAEALYEARRDRRPIEPFTAAAPHLTVADGYAIQRELVPMLLAEGDEIVGYKVGLTSKAMQRLVGVDAPDFAPMLRSTRYRDGGVVGLDRFIAPKMEAEIAVVLGEPLRGPGATVADAARAASGLAAALEIVDSRILDWRIRLVDTVADLASNGAMVMSDRVVPLDGIDPRLIGMVLGRNGTVVDTAAGAAALGNPLAVVAWLANVLGEHGRSLEPGHAVLTGALHAAVPVTAGDVFVAEFDRLGSVAAVIVESTGQLV